jgi:hypothetical protein
MSVRPATMMTSFSRPLKPEAVELVEPAGALAVGGEVDGAAVDAGFDAPLGVGDEGGLLGDGAAVEEDAPAALLEAAVEDFVEGVV